MIPRLILTLCGWGGDPRCSTSDGNILTGILELNPYSDKRETSAAQDMSFAFPARVAAHPVTS